MEGTNYNIVNLISIPPVLLLLSFALLASAAPPPTDFIRTSCRTAAYPDVCMTSLASYARSIRRSPRQLAHVALSISASRAGDTSNYLSSISAVAGPKSVRSRSSTSYSFEDCTVVMAHSANRLRKSVRELSRMGRAGSRRFVRRAINVQTWVSAALTDQNACLGSLPADDSGSAAIRKKVVEASRMTSNALSFVNRIAFRN